MSELGEQLAQAAKCQDGTCDHEKVDDREDLPKNIKSIKRDSSDREDWLKIYCSVVGHEAGSDYDYIVETTDDLFKAFKERWAEK